MTDTSKIIPFLKHLAANNNRDWFNAHKPEYLQVKAAADAIADTLIAEIAAVAPDAARLTAKDCTYRIYRDTRFSADKTPYKTHIGIFVNPLTGKKGESLGWYLHIEPGNCFVCVGTGWVSPKVLKSLRQGIYDEIDEYREIVESPTFKDAFDELGMDCLKTAPKGFDKNWPYIDYLKPRLFGALKHLPDSAISSKNLIEILRPAITQGALYNRFCNYFILEALGLDIDL